MCVKLHGNATFLALNEVVNQALNGIQERYKLQFFYYTS